MQGVPSCECVDCEGHQHTFMCHNIATIQYRVPDNVWFPICLPCFAKHISETLKAENGDVEEAIRALGLDETN